MLSGNNAIAQTIEHYLAAIGQCENGAIFSRWYIWWLFCNSYRLPLWLFIQIYPPTPVVTIASAATHPQLLRAGNLRTGVTGRASSIHTLPDLLQDDGFIVLFFFLMKLQNEVSQLFFVIDGIEEEAVAFRLCNP